MKSGFNATNILNKIEEKLKKIDGKKALFFLE